MKKIVGVVCVLLVVCLSACQKDSETKKQDSTEQTSVIQEASSSSVSKGSSVGMAGKLQALYSKNNAAEYNKVGFYASEQNKKNYLIAFLKEDEKGSAEQIRIVTSKGGKFTLETEKMSVQLDGNIEDTVFSLPDVQTMLQFSVKHTYYEDMGGEVVEKYYYYVHDITEKEPRLTNTKRAPSEYKPEFALKGAQCENNAAEVKRCLNDNF